MFSTYRWHPLLPKLTCWEESNAPGWHRVARTAVTEGRWYSPSNSPGHVTKSTNRTGCITSWTWSFFPWDAGINRTEKEHSFSSKPRSSLILTNDMWTRETTGRWHPRSAQGCRLTGTYTAQSVPTDAHSVYLAKLFSIPPLAFSGAAWQIIRCLPM